MATQLPSGNMIVYTMAIFASCQCEVETACVMEKSTNPIMDLMISPDIVKNVQGDTALRGCYELYVRLQGV
ncbi:hypothetical protein BJY52DRAFT_1315427 [Lactarius psammicola]|nr:hypothetical protein BJY52DRAFT_1315427 [Lactarius psammicola]